MSIEAMRLADELDCRGMNRPSWKDQFDAGYELRRLHKENIELRQAIEQAQKQEPVADGLPLVIAGAIFDFAGYLTTRDKVIEIGSTANASPIADLVKEWAALRELSLNDAAVLSWQEWLYAPTLVATNDTSEEHVDEMQEQRQVTSPPQRQWVGLTDEEILGLWSNDHDRVSFARAIEAKLREKNT